MVASSMLPCPRRRVRGNATKDAAEEDDDGRAVAATASRTAPANAAWARRRPLAKARSVGR
jgi:hypothetical protein